MNKKGKTALVIGIIFIFILILILFFFFITTGPSNDSYYIEQISQGKLVNPVSNLTIEEAKDQFNETFVYYLLYEIGAQNLHNPPLSKDKPKIKIIVDELTFSAIIDEGIIIVSQSEIQNEDIIIRTNREEAVKMLKAEEYIAVSFEEGRSALEMKSSKSVLFSKGYLGLYQELTGVSVTGSVIRIYSE